MWIGRLSTQKTHLQLAIPVFQDDVQYAGIPCSFPIQHFRMRKVLQFVGFVEFWDCQICWIFWFLDSMIFNACDTRIFQTGNTKTEKLYQFWSGKAPQPHHLNHITSAPHPKPVQTVEMMCWNEEDSFPFKGLASVSACKKNRTLSYIIPLTQPYPWSQRRMPYPYRISCLQKCWHFCTGEIPAWSSSTGELSHLKPWSAGNEQTKTEVGPLKRLITATGPSSAAQMIFWISKCVISEYWNTNILIFDVWYFCIQQV